MHAKFCVARKKMHAKAILEVDLTAVAVGMYFAMYNRARPQ